jgi:hypothetical protein
MKTRGIRAFLLIALVLLPACGPAASPGPGPPGTILFRDDFSRPGSGWDRHADATNVTDYQGGGYRIRVGEAHEVLWSNPGLRLADGRIEVDATQISGPDDNTFGVLCRYQDARDFYFFLISSDGYVGIGKVAQGVQTLISGARLTRSNAVRLGPLTNHIRGDCVANELILYVNGFRVAEAQDVSFTQGDTGLLAGTYDTAGADILFRNFLVTSP